MAHRVVEFTTDKRFVRRRREQATIEAMVRMYCDGHGHDRPADAAHCAACGTLLAYATRRLERCLFGDAKPACAQCLVHCYRADMRERIREVMRWAGPRMLLRHPILAVRHLIDERRPSPKPPERRSRGAAKPAAAPHCEPD
jgi:hypothetical protein